MSKGKRTEKELCWNSLQSAKATLSLAGCDALREARAAWRGLCNEESCVVILESRGQRGLESVTVSVSSLFKPPGEKVTYQEAIKNLKSVAKTPSRVSVTSGGTID